MTKRNLDILNEALRLRVRPSVLRTVILKRKCSVKKAGQIVERLLNQQRQSRFDFDD